jgi:hypothetical protein
LYDLNRSEIALENEISLLSENLEKMDQKPQRSNGDRKKEKKGDNSTGITHFDHFLIQNGGHNGGWKPEYHRLFMKILRNFNIRDQFDDLVEHTAQNIPEQTVITAKQHILWYQTYLQLAEEKRMAIRNWREKQQAS